MHDLDDIKYLVFPALIVDNIASMTLYKFKTARTTYIIVQYISSNRQELSFRDSRHSYKDDSVQFKIFILITN